MALQIKNFAASTLSADLTTIATQLTVATGEGDRFAAVTPGDWFPLVLVGSGNPPTPEIVRCTDRVGDVLTIVREQEGTTAVALTTGAIVSHRMTEAAFAEFLRASEALKSGFGIAGGSANALTANVAAVDEYTDGVTVRLRAQSTNTNVNVTLNVNGLGAVPVNRFGDQALVVGSIQIAGVYEFVYDDGEAAFVIANAYPIEHTNTAVVPAGVGVPGVVSRRDPTLATFDVDGEDTDYVSEKSASIIIADAFATSAENNLPFNWRHRGTDNNMQTVLNGQTYQVNSLQSSSFSDLTVDAGGILEIIGNSVGVIRCSGTFTLTGNLNVLARPRCPPQERVVGPTSGPTPVPGGSTVLQLAQAQFNRDPITNAIFRKLFVGQFKLAVESGLPLQLFHGGSSCNYLESSPSLPFQTNLNDYWPAAGGIIVIAKDIVINSGASITGLHGQNRANFGGSGDADRGPTAGGMACFCGETVAMDAAATFELGLEAGTVNSTSDPASGLQNAVYWRNKYDSEAWDEINMPNGNVFQIEAPLGADPTYTRVC